MLLSSCRIHLSVNRHTSTYLSIYIFLSLPFGSWILPCSRPWVSNVLPCLSVIQVRLGLSLCWSRYRAHLRFNNFFKSQTSSRKESHVFNQLKFFFFHSYIALQTKIIMFLHWFHSLTFQARWKRTSVNYGSLSISSELCLRRSSSSPFLQAS